MQLSPAIQEAKTIFQRHRGILRTSEALKLGLHPRTLYTMRDKGMLEQLSRGLYRLREAQSFENPDLAMIALNIPKAVICLVSALAFHELTTVVPSAVDIAIHHKARQPTLDYPPIRVFWFSGSAFHEGVETFMIDELPIRVFEPAKSIADSFKYRNQIGLDIALEALKLYRQRRDFSVKKLLYYARICRISKLMQRYLEVLV